EEELMEVDPARFASAVAHREHMPAGVIPRARAASTSGIRVLAALPLAGNWSYFGPVNWAVGQAIIPGPWGGRVDAVAAIGAGNPLFAGSFGGLMRSTDSGATWTALSDTWPMPAVGSLAARQINGQVV